VSWPDDLQVFCADIGSVGRNNFAWARRIPAADHDEEHAPGRIDALARAVRLALEADQPVALGLEMPMFVPVPHDWRGLGRARPSDVDAPAWSSGIGASVMTTGIVQMAWILGELPQVELHLRWSDFAQARRGLLLWEAFVTRDAKGDSHEADARIGLEAFCAQLPEVGDESAAETERPFSLAAAAALWAGWNLDPALLHESGVLVRA